MRFWIISCEVVWRSEARLPSRILLFLYSKQYCFKPQKNPKIRRQVLKINVSGHGKGHKLISIGVKSFFLDFSRWRTKHSVMADALLSLPGRTKVRKTSLPLASTRSFLVKKPPQAPLQQQGQEGVRLKSGKHASRRWILGRTRATTGKPYGRNCVGKHLSSCTRPTEEILTWFVLLLTYLYFILFVKLHINIGFNYLLFGLILAWVMVINKECGVNYIGWLLVRKTFLKPR